MPPLLLAASAAALGWVLLPFCGAIMWGIVTAMLFVPVFRWLLPRLNQRRNLAAGLVMLLVLVTGVLPFAVVTASLARIAKLALPVPSRFKEELAIKFMAVVRATVKGSVLVAAIQGALGGIGFWFLGVKAALLWAVVMAFLSLVPMIGAGLVWLPVAAHFFISGQPWQGLVLVAYGVFVIGLADNLLRPILVGKDAGLPDYVVMITTLGGMAVFGINGFIIGPTIAAMFIAVWHLALAAHSREG